MSGERVLVVDDERKIREVVGSYLERQGHQVALLEDGEPALAAMTEQRPNLVVLDLVLPDSPGEEVAHVKNLRRKLGEPSRHPRYLVTEIGIGCRFGLKPDA